MRRGITQRDAGLCLGPLTQKQLGWNINMCAASASS